MKKQRNDGIESKNRVNTVEQNLAHWNEMKLGTPEGLKWCIRAKLNMKDKVKCLRDPVFYRCNVIPHHKTGTTFKVYPCYDFACPIVDSLEGVTHAMRTIEYRDRNALYKWVYTTAKLRPVEIHDYSRLCFVNTVLSKRKLQYFVEKGLVEGWNDPRFPTVQGIMRRGLTVAAITEFMLEQGASKTTNLMEWDKLWAINKKVIDPIAPRYTAIGKDSACLLNILNGPDTPQKSEVALHPKNEAIGKKDLWLYKKIFIENEDAKIIAKDEKITLLKCGNCLITNIKTENGKIELEGKLLPDDKDFKSTKKISWIAAEPSLNIDGLIYEFDHIITKNSLEDTDNIENFINPKTRFETQFIGEIQMKNLHKGDIIQIERRGFYYVDSPWVQGGPMLTLHFIPEGKTKEMSVIKTKIDVAAASKGAGEKTSKKKLKKKEKKDVKEGAVNPDVKEAKEDKKEDVKEGAVNSDVKEAKKEKKEDEKAPVPKQP